MLLPNGTRAPLDRVEVRRALSLAIDRELVVEVAMYGYVSPAHPTGLPDGLADWRIAPEDHAVRYDPAEAERILDDAGFRRGADGWRVDAEGRPLRVEITAPAGWSDWVRAAQVIAKNLQSVGVDARLRTFDFSAWFEKMLRGDFDLARGWTEEGPTPYTLYRGMMSAREVKPVGEAASRNWHRVGMDRVDALLAEMEGTADPQIQRRAAAELQRIFTREMPAIPLFPSPSWGEYSTRRFVGWPTADNPYARLSPNHPPESLLVLTRLERR